MDSTSPLPCFRPAALIQNPILRMAVAGIAWIGLGTAAGSHATAQEPQISAQLNASEVFVGESLYYTVEISNVDDPPEPDLSEFTDFDVRLQGQRSQNSMSVVIVNGSRRETRRFGKVFQYALTPKKTGQLTLPAPKVVIDGEEIQGQPLTLTVKGESDQETIFLNTSVQPGKVYPTQQFTVTLEIDVRKLPEPLAQRSPLSIQETVALSVPWLSEDGLPNASPESEPLEVLRPMLANRGQQDGFGINAYSVGGASLFSRSRPAQFVPPSKDVTRTLKDGTQADFVRYTIQQTFRAERPGKISVPAASVKGMFAIPESDPIDGEQLFAIGNEASLEVSEVPLENRPDTYCGGVGTFEVSASVAPSEARVGDPMTLTLNVFGDGTLDLIVPPDLERMDGFAEQFRIYEPTSKSVSNGRTFTFTLRPETADVTEIAPIPFSFFDVEKGEYVTAKTEALPVSIQPATQLQMQDIVTDVGSSEPQDPNNAPQKAGGLVANHRTLAPAVAESLTWRQWCSLWALILFGTVSVSMIRSAGKNRRQDPVRLRKRRAFTTAANAMKTAETAASQPDGVSAMALGKIVTGLIADVTGQQATGMTSSEATATLAGLGAPEELQQKTKQLLDDCDAARFGASAQDQQGLLTRCRELVGELTKELRA